MSKALDTINLYRNHPLVVAARGNDQVSEHTRNLADAMACMGLDVDVVRHVCTNRLALLTRGAPIDANLGTTILAMMFDALAIGWTGRGYATDGIPSGLEITEPITQDQLDAAQPSRIIIPK